MPRIKIPTSSACGRNFLRCAIAFPQYVSGGRGKCFPASRRSKTEQTGTQVTDLCGAQTSGPCSSSSNWPIQISYIFRES